MKILVLNSGSSSQKTCLYEIGETLPDDPPARLWDDKIEWHGDIADGVVKNSNGTVQRARVRISSRAEAVEHLLRTLGSGKTHAFASASEIDVVGHRVVHGGPKCEQPILITPEVKAEIASMSAFAPLHNRAELDGMEIIERLFGAVPQVAVFDTGFHRKMPLASAVYPGPYEWIGGTVGTPVVAGLTAATTSSRQGLGS